MFSKAISCAHTNAAFYHFQNVIFAWLLDVVHVINTVPAFSRQIPATMNRSAHRRAPFLPLLGNVGAAVRNEPMRSAHATNVKSNSVAIEKFFYYESRTGCSFDVLVCSVSIGRIFKE